MNIKNIFSMTVILIFIFISSISFAIGPADTLRNEIGEIIPISDPGEPGIDFFDHQFIASFLPGYITLPFGETESYLKDCTVESELNSLLKSHNVSYVEQVFTGSLSGDTIRVVYGDTCYVPDLSQIYLLIQDKGARVLNAIEEMYKHKATLYAEPNFIRTVDAIPNDVDWDTQWNLKNDNNGIGCPTAWNSTVGSPVKLAIIDTGIYYDHEDLGGPGFPNNKVVGGYDFAINIDDPIDWFGNIGHGSLCAGIAGALTNNYDFIAGIAGGWNSGVDDIGTELYAIKIFYGNGHWAGDNVAARGIWAAADPIRGFGCKILSMSWSGPENTYSETIRFAIRYAYALGVSIVCSKGNHGTDQPYYPPDYDRSWITAVAGYDYNGLYCQQAICGYTSNYGGGIDIAAPGFQIPSTSRIGTTEMLGGTSAACPHVSGAIALIRSLLEDDLGYNGGFHNEDTEWILKFSAFDDLPSSDNNVWTWNERYGHGDLRISTAIDRIASPIGLDRWEFSDYYVTGGYVFGNPEFGEGYFYGSPLNGRYYYDKYEVRIDVIYREQFSDVPFVWGLGYNTVGWSGSIPNHQVGFCEVVPGSQTATSCQLRTFVYEIWDYDTIDPFGYLPCEPDQVSLHYRLWGEKIGGFRPKFDEEYPEDASPMNETIFNNYPNPFNASTIIRYDLAKVSDVSIQIYDILGRKKESVVENNKPVGSHQYIWNAKDQPSGIYFYKIQAGDYSETKKMMLLR